MFGTIDGLNKVHKVAQCLLAVFTLLTALSAFFSFWATVVLAFFAFLSWAVAFGAGTKRDALKDRQIAQREQWIEEQHRREKDELTQENRYLQRDLECEKRKREEFEHRISGGTLRQ